MAVRELDLTEILLKAFRAPFDNWRPPLVAYVIFAVVPWIILDLVRSYLFGIPTLLLGSPNPASRMPSNVVLWMLVLAVVASALYAGFAVLVHRLVAGLPKPWALTKSWMDYVITCIVLGLILIIPYVLFSIYVMPPILVSINDSLLWLASVTSLSIFGSAIFCRFALVLPAAALGADRPIRRSLRITRGNGIKMFVGIVLTTLVATAVFSAPGYLLEPLIQALDPSNTPNSSKPSLLVNAIMEWTYMALGYIPAVFAVSFLTQSFIALNTDEPSVTVPDDRPEDPSST